MGEIIIIGLAAFVIGWSLRGYSDRIRARLIDRFISSDIGREVIREVVVNQMAKAAPKEPPHV